MKQPCDQRDKQKSDSDGTSSRPQRVANSVSIRLERFRDASFFDAGSNLDAGSDPAEAAFRWLPEAAFRRYMRGIEECGPMYLFAS